ncbi:hypothetical protein LJE72_23315 [Desulfosporosinus sp. SRJS8]|uniref:hypothetical protein n=1 Tax=Desulfosporosinus shakirovi TaxID=2885154 RepID=UPI001E551682|nr:hypothetical protein [Desulfosporosinus sp. SRJS8]MCB8818410.1 hypothetical protein [Desulfosporosinus sp. SRJS8]
MAQRALPSLTTVGAALPCAMCLMCRIPTAARTAPLLFGRCRTDMPGLLRKRWKIPLENWTTKANCLPRWFLPPAMPWMIIFPTISPN